MSNISKECKRQRFDVLNWECKIISVKSFLSNVMTTLYKVTLHEGFCSIAYLELVIRQAELSIPGLV